jgi:raffinose/stachyose/melibiose transport system permease protein
MKSKNETLNKILLHVFLWLLVLVIVVPLLWLILNSLKTNNELFRDSLALPKKWQYMNYVNAWTKGLSIYFVNSVVVTIVSVALTCIIAALAAYSIARFEFPFKNIIFFMILGGLMVSDYSILVPLYKLLTTMNLYNTRPGLILVYIAFRLPFATFLIYSYFLGLPKDIEESAFIDGCSPMRVFWQIVMPLSTPIITSAAIMCGIYIWNEFLFALVFLEDRALMTMPIGLQVFKGQLKIDYASSMSGIVICSIPMIIAFIIFQKQFVRGLTAGSVKG